MGIGQWGAFEIVDTNGTRLPPGTLIRVTVPPAAAPGGTLATLYTDLTGTTQGPNPVPLDQYSNLTFYAADATQYGIQAVEASGTAPLEKVFLAGVSAGGAGSVTQVNAGTAVQVVNPTSTPTVSVVLGSTAGTAAAGNDPRFSQGAAGVTATINGTYAIPIGSGTLNLLMQGSTTITMPTARQGAELRILLSQDANGARVPTFTGVEWPGGLIPTWSITGNAQDCVRFECYDGTHWVGFLEGLAVSTPATGGGGGGGGGGPANGTFLRPFSTDSLWYRPVSAAIAAGAFYGRGDGSTNKPNFPVPANGVDIDRENILQGSNSNPSRELLDTGGFIGGGASPSSGSSSGRFLNIPLSYFLKGWNNDFADAGEELSNASLAYLSPDGTTWTEGNSFSADPAGGNLSAYTLPFPTHPMSGRGTFGARGASGMSAVGGSLRPGELEGSSPITHVVKWTWPMGRDGRQDAGFGGGAGYTAPAQAADSGFNTGSFGVGNHYGGAENGTPWVWMGSLLAIRPQDLSAALAAVSTVQGRNLANCLCTYGGYITENSAAAPTFTVCSLQMDAAAWATSGIGSGPNAVRTDIGVLTTFLYVVMNNNPPT